MRITITGATGFLGGNLLRFFHERGHAVRYLSRGSRQAIAAKDLQNTEVIAGDLSDERALDAVCANADWVIHAAAAVSFLERDRKQIEQVNIEGTRALLAAATRAKVKRFVHVSTVDAVGLPTDGSPGNETTPYDVAKLGNTYSDTKLAAEAVVRAADLHTVIVNPGFMIGAFDAKPSSNTMVLQIMKGSALLAPSGGNCFVDVLDVCRGIALAGEHGARAERYIFGGHNLTYRDFFTRTAKLVGARAPLGIAPNWLAMASATVVEGVSSLTKRAPLFDRAQTRMSFLPHYYDSGRAIRELGYTISPIEDAIVRSQQWFLANGYR